MSGTNERRVKNDDTGGEKGQKDQRFELLPWGALAEVAALYAKGAEKYDDNNWRRGYAWSLSSGALGRHFAAFMEGEDYDEETGAHHLTSVVFHALALLTFKDEHPELDDRPSTVLGREERDARDKAAIKQAVERVSCVPPRPLVADPPAYVVLVLLPTGDGEDDVSWQRSQAYPGVYTYEDAEHKAAKLRARGNRTAVGRA